MNPTRPEDKWNRVSADNPCPICGKPDWCLIAKDGSAAICPRTDSDREIGEAGYLHLLNGSTDRVNHPRHRVICVPMSAPGSTEMADLAASCHDRLNQELLDKLSASLGLTGDSLSRLGIGWDGEAWTFPMKNARGAIVGIRRRLPDGRKLSVTGSREGLHIPLRLPDDGQLLICEGPTDTAALLDLGFAAIGRPSCLGGTAHIIDFAKGCDVVVVADGDAPGQRGAAKLANTLRAYCREVRILTPPAGIKDARAWKNAGASHQDVIAMIHSSELLRLQIHVGGAQDGWDGCEGDTPLKQNTMTRSCPSGHDCDSCTSAFGTQAATMQGTQKTSGKVSQ